MFFKFNKKGETLIEVMAALTALSLAALSSVTVIISVMGTTALTKDYLLAQNFAREGIEGVIAIRDSSWLRHPTVINCWLNVDPDSCGMVSPTSGYKLLRDTETGKFWLSATTKMIATELNPAYIINSSTGVVPMFTQNPEWIVPLSGQTVFYRMIIFDAGADANSYKITAMVNWQSKSGVSSYSLSSIVTNYAK